MGWDAHSSADMKSTIRKLYIRDPKIRKLFKEAETFVREKSNGHVDIYLHIGSLDTSTCGKMLERAVGWPVYDEDGWNVDKVKKLNAEANWDFKFKKEDAWAYWSARKFLEVCAQANLSISFSW